MTGATLLKKQFLLKERTFKMEKSRIGEKKKRTGQKIQKEIQNAVEKITAIKSQAKKKFLAWLKKTNINTDSEKLKGYSLSALYTIFGFPAFSHSSKIFKISSCVSSYK